MQSPVDLKEARVLMVDDTPANIDVLRKVLSVEGYKLSFANSGEKALQIAGRSVPDLILLDVMMPPGIDGYETCKRLKENEVTKDIPVIFITAKTDVDDVVQGFQLGAVDYISKPFQQEEVRVRVRTHITGRLLLKRQQKLFAELKASEERFRLLSTRSPIGIFQTDSSGNYIYTNPFWQELFELSPEQGQGEQWLERVHSEERPAVEQQWRACLASGQEFAGDFRLAKSDDNLCWVEIHATPQFDDENRLEGFVGVVEDITQSKLNEEAMRQAKEAAESEVKAKSEHLASMTHELRTPLNAIIGYSEMLFDDVDEEQDREDLDKITSASRYLLNLINNILDISKIEANKMPLMLETFQVGALLGEVSATIKPLFEKNQNQFVMDYAGESLGEMHNDPTKLRQIMFNLLSNASKFTREGRITLKATRRSGQDGAEWLDFAVSDTGIGMTPEQVARLFQKYVQATDTTSKNYGGTGLGLVLCRQLSHIMGGEIYVDSEVGRGTTFTVSLPAHLDSPTARES